jgi:hypothetical protein
MNIFNWRACDVFELIQNRYDWTPKRVESFSNRTFYNASGLSSQNNQYVWRPNTELPVVGAPSTALTFPLFFGVYQILVGNDDPVSTSSANSFLIFTAPVLQNINKSIPFYNTQAGTVQRYGVGTFAGRAFPAPGIVEDWFSFDRLLLAPWLSIQEFTDGTGSIFVSVEISFSGFRIDMI